MALQTLQRPQIPLFLLPAFASQPFHTTAKVQSRIGAAPIPVPPSVKVSLLLPPAPKRGSTLSRIQPPRTIEVEGPLGSLSLPIPAYVQFSHDTERSKVALDVLDRKERSQRAIWGTTRARLASHILGVSEGHTVVLRLIGVGYRASIESTAETKKAEYDGQAFVSLKVGFSHPIELGIPRGVRASTPLPTRILLEGANRQVVRQFAAEIRAWRKPEPYKGKGIFVDDETIKLKAKRIK